jgi:hypothetical protein
MNASCSLSQPIPTAKLVISTDEDREAHWWPRDAVIMAYLSKCQDSPDNVSSQFTEAYANEAL